MPSSDKMSALNVRVIFEDTSKDKTPQNVRAIVFDARGAYLTEMPLKLGDATDKPRAELTGIAALNIPASHIGQTLRVVLAPPSIQNRSGDTGQTLPNINQLLKQGLPEQRFRYDPAQPKLDWQVSAALWPWLIWCPCTVRGRLIKRVYLPDGQTLELPICHSRITVCTVTEIPWIINQLPERDIFRLRDDISEIMLNPQPLPPLPDPEPWPSPYARTIKNVLNTTSLGFGDRDIMPQPYTALKTMQSGSASAAMSASTECPTCATHGSAENITAAVRAQSTHALAITPSEKMQRTQNLLSATSANELRRHFIDESELLWPYFCYFDWFNRWFWYATDCSTVVDVDETGHFEATLWYPCGSPTPNVYVSAEQWNGSIWNSIYAPPLFCNIYWNYNCGSLITINVTDPNAQPCVPEIPVTPPQGLDTWVMPFAIGATKIWGTAGPGSAPAGWVRADGYTDYSSISNAPFGGTFALAQTSSINIPNDNEYYYRWSYRKGTSGGFTNIAAPVGRTYVRQVPSQLPSFPNYPLGPRLTDLFRFKPQVFPTAEVALASDPAGTTYYWPVDNFTGDIYSAYWDTDTNSLDPVTHQPDPVRIGTAAGDYQLKMEVFDHTEALVLPGPATFQFILPSGIASDGVTILSRTINPATELDAGGLIFTVHIDNGRCSAATSAPVANGTTVADVCGFLRYTSGSHITIAFDAAHPRNHAVFSFGMIRGVIDVTAADASGEVAAAAGAYAHSGTGHYQHNFGVHTLLGTCVNAAFAEALYVTAKATNGSARLQDYDSSALRAFALAV